MRLIYLMIACVLIAFGATGYITYIKNSREAIKPILTPPVKLSLTPETAESQKSAEAQSCSQFEARFGISADELVSFINNEPESAQVMQGYRRLYGRVISLPLEGDFPFIVNLDSHGKIVDLICQNSEEERDYNQDFDFTIPEADFIQIIRYREVLEEEQAADYLKNLTTYPVEVKNIILERIYSLS